jgi:hypothetical protein
MSLNPTAPKPIEAPQLPKLPALSETVAGINVELIEESVEGKPKKLKVRGHFGNYDEATANKRLYPKPLWEREITKLDKAMVERQMYGELDHPSDGRTMLNRVSHLVTKLWLDHGKVMGEAEILDTDAGRNLQALLQAGCKVGVSSRGYGSTKPNEKGEDVVQEDYKLVTFDFVAEPAAGAFPTVFFEWNGKKIDSKSVTPEMLREAAPELTQCISEEAVKAREDELAATWAEKLEVEKVETEEKTRKTLREEFARELLIHVSKAKKELREEVAQEVATDPSIAGAKLALESIKKALTPFLLSDDQQQYVESLKAELGTKATNLEKQLAETLLRLKGVEEDKAQIEATLKEIGYKLFVEQILDGNAEGRALIGDLKQYASAAEIKAKAEAVKAELAKRKPVAVAEAVTRPVAAPSEDSVSLHKELEIAVMRADRAESQLENFEAKLAKQHKIVEALENKLDATEKALEKAFEAQELSATQLYAEQKLTNNPKAGKIRSVIESSNVRSRKQVDQIVDEFREPIRDPEALEAVRARIRATTRGGIERMPLEEEEGPSQVYGPRDLAGIGVDLRNFKALSGIAKKK